jgi:hypothetical protein
MPLIGFLIMPELIIYFILMARWLDSGTYYYKIKADKNPNQLHHDPATFNLFSRVSVKSGRMDEVWDPGNTSLKQLSISKNTISRIDKINVAPSMIIITLCFIFLFFFSVSISFF